LKEICDLRKEVQLFMDTKGKPLPEFSDEDWSSDCFSGGYDTASE
jgi:hypothetical protein